MNGKLFTTLAAGMVGLALLAGCASMPAATGQRTAISQAGSSTATVTLVTEAAPAATVTVTAPAATATGATTEAAPASTAAVTATAVITATAGVSATATVAPSAVAAPPATSQAAAAASTIACTPGQLTPAETEGPYYKANPPEAATLLQPGMGGTKLTVTGYVLDSQCQPVPGARVDFWQADSEGQYDNQGYTLRGYQVTDAEGRYTLETVVPGLYPGRTRHIHVKVTAPGGPTLTTQLYFPDEAANATDRIYDQRLLVSLEETADRATGTFNFVINTQ